MGCVPDLSNGKVREVLNTGSYWIRIVLKILNERRSERYHCTYVVPVALDHDLPSRFLRIRMDVEIVDRTVQEWVYMRPDVLPETVDVGPVTESTTADGQTVATILWRTRDAADAKGGATHHTRQVVTDAEAKAVLQWKRQRDRVEHCLIDHPSVSVVRDPVWKMVQSVAISKDHLEKDQIQWWSEHDLRQVLDDRGHFGVHRFRPYFLPVLQTILQELSLDPPPRSVSDDGASPKPDP